MPWWPISPWWVFSDEEEPPPLRDTRHNAAPCLLPNAARGACFEFDTDGLQRSVVSKFDCAAPRVNVQVVDIAGGSCPEAADFGVPCEEMTLCLRRVR